MTVLVIGVVVVSLMGIGTISYVLWLFWWDLHLGRPHEWEEIDPGLPSHFHRCVRCGKVEWKDA